MEALINSRLCKGSLCRQEDIEQLSMDGSHYSFSTGILPSLGGSSARRIKLKWFIISPYDRRYRCKSVLILGFSLWACDFLFSLRSFVCVYICAYKRLVIYCFYWFDFFFPCIIYMKDFLLCYSFWFMLDCRNLSLPYCSCSFNLFYLLLASCIKLILFVIMFDLYIYIFLDFFSKLEFFLFIICFSLYFFYCL